MQEYQAGNQQSNQAAADTPEIHPCAVMPQLLSHILRVQPTVLPALPHADIRQEMKIPIQCLDYLTNGRFHHSVRKGSTSTEVLFHHGVGIVVVDGLEVFSLYTIPAERIVTLCCHRNIAY